MKNINSYIIEKFKITKNTKGKYGLSIEEWFNYFKEKGFDISKDKVNDYYIHFSNKFTPLFRFKSENLLGRNRCWEPVSSTLKDAPLIETKLGFEELIDSDKLDIANEKLMQYSFTINNADIIINTLNRYK